MNRIQHKTSNSHIRKNRVKASIVSGQDRPRLSVNISNRHIRAQIIDDVNGQTLLAVATDSSKAVKGSLTEKAVWVGEQIAAAAVKKKIKRVVFDRGGHLYHGRVKALADAARKSGLEF